MFDQGAFNLKMKIKRSCSVKKLTSPSLTYFNVGNWFDHHRGQKPNKPGPVPGGTI